MPRPPARSRPGGRNHAGEENRWNGGSVLREYRAHNPNGPICTAAALQLVTSIANFLILEQGASNTAAYGEIFPGGWRESLAEMWVPEVPGVGVDFSPAYVKEHAMTV